MKYNSIRKIAKTAIYDQSVKDDLKKELDKIPYMSPYVKEDLDKIIDQASDVEDLRITLDVIWQASETLDEKLDDIIGE